MLSAHVPRPRAIKKIGPHEVVTLVHTVPPHAVSFPVLVVTLNWDNYDHSDTSVCRSRSHSSEVGLYPV